MYLRSRILVLGREQTRNRISFCVSGVPQELLHSRQERSTTERDAIPLGHRDTRTTLDIYTQIADPEVARRVNQVTNRVLGWDGEVEPGSVQ